MEEQNREEKEHAKDPMAGTPSRSALLEHDGSNAVGHMVMGSIRKVFDRPCRKFPFSQAEDRSHCRMLSLKMTQGDLCDRNITLRAEWRVNWK